jgi:UDP-GlcNAc:undecaprenyl-phosphate GlcNAc-1-phosphate transferase
MPIFIIPFLSSIIISLLIIRYSHIYKGFAMDATGGGPQKFHTKPVPRVGGIGIATGLILAGLLMGFQRGVLAQEYWFLLISAIPAFTGGLSEDITKKVGAMPRLLLTFAAAAIGYFLLDASISRVDIPFIDFILKYPLLSLTFTMFAVGGIANAINIIDGFNGIAGMVSLIILSALGYVAYLNGDGFLMSVCLATGGAVLGFLIWNYPSGMIFLGDGGAYLLGFLIAEVSVLLVNRHPEVSAWFPMLLVVYPITEVFFSIYRKKFLRGISPGLPDGLHFHMLIYKRLIRWMIGLNDKRFKLRRNSMTSPYLWAITAVSALPAMLFWQETVVLMCLVITFVFFYLWLYWRIVRFKSPKWLIVRRQRRQ